MWRQIKHLLFPMLCLVGQHTSPLLPFVAPNLPHKPPLCCQLLLHPQITSAHCTTVHTNKHTQLLLLKHCFIHTLKCILTPTTLQCAAYALPHCTVSVAKQLKPHERGRLNARKAPLTAQMSHFMCSAIFQVHTRAQTRKMPPPPQTHTSDQAEKLTRTPLKVCRQNQLSTL